MGNCKGRYLISARNWKSPTATWRPVSKKTTASANACAAFWKPCRAAFSRSKPDRGFRLSIPRRLACSAAASSRPTHCRPRSPSRSTGHARRAKSSNYRLLVWNSLAQNNLVRISLLRVQPNPSGSPSATPGWSKVRLARLRCLSCAMSARRRSSNMIASISGGGRPWLRCRPCLRMKSGIPWAASNSLPASWLKRISQAKAAAGSNTSRPACARFLRPSTTYCTCTTRPSPSSPRLNAFRFMPGGGWLSIRGVDGAASEGPLGDGVEIIVRDTGPGIAPDDLPRVFEAGFSTRAGSSGLGLAVCHRILEQHGGSIAVESRPGYGATFRLCLPRNGATGAAGATGAGYSSVHPTVHPPDPAPPEHHPEYAAEPAAASGAQL